MCWENVADSVGLILVSPLRAEVLILSTTKWCRFMAGGGLMVGCKVANGFKSRIMGAGVSLFILRIREWGFRYALCVCVCVCEGEREWASGGF